MPSPRWFVACLLFLVSSFPVRAQGLAWKFRQGDSFLVEEVTKVRQTIKIMDTETRQDMDQTKVLLYTVLGQDADGNVVLDKKIESVKAAVVAGSAPPDAKLLQQLAGARFTVTLDRQRRRVRLDGYEDLIQKIAKEAEAAKMVRSLMTEEGLTLTDERLFLFLPVTGSAPASWQLGGSLPLGPLGSLTAVDDYRLSKDGSSKGVQKIVVASNLTYVPPRENPDAPIKVARGFLKAEQAAGTILFDPARGRLVQADHRRVLRGTLALTLATGTVDMDWHQEHHVALRVLDR